MEDPYPPTNQRFDGEYDIFNYGLAGNSGSFIITNRPSKQATVLDGDRSKVSYNTIGYTGDTHINYFDIVDPNGVKYRMGTNSSGNDVGLENTTVAGGLWASTAWLVRSIEPVVGESMSFDYERRIERGESLNVTYAVRDGEASPTTFIDANLDSHGNCIGGTYTSQNLYSDYAVPFLKTITTPKETIAFIRDEDNLSNFQDNLIKAIEVRDIQGNLIRRIEFQYTWSKYDNFPSFFFCLSQIRIQSNSAQEQPKVYKFEYYGSDNSGSSITYDYFGYIMNHDNSGISIHGIPDSYGNDPIQRLLTSSNVDGPSSSNCATWPRVLKEIPFSPDAAFSGPQFFFRTKNVVSPPVLQTLSKITYPTGGYTFYGYESNIYADGAGNSVYAGGLRIGTISSYDVSGEPSFAKTYRYGTGENGFGIPLITPNYSKDFGTTELLSVFQNSINGLFLEGFSDRQTLYNSSLLGSDAISDAASRGLVYYPEVNVYQAGKFGSNRNGKERYVFSAWYFHPARYDFVRTNPSFKSGNTQNARTLHRAHSRQMVIDYDFSAKEPTLITHEFYDLQKNLVQRENYVYGAQTTGSFSGLKVRRFVTGYYKSDFPDPYTTFGIESIFDYMPYSIEAGNTFLNQKITTQFVNNIPTLSTVENYSYNDIFQLKSEDLTNSLGETKTTEYTYPTDYTDLSATDPVTLGVKKLQTLNIIEPVLEKRQYLTKGSSKSLTFSQYTSYYNTVPLPDKIWTTELSASITDFVPTATSTGAVTLDTRYKPQLSFDYSVIGNLTRQTKRNDVSVSYIWDYSQRFPIAEVKNAAVQDIAYTSFEADGTGGWQVSKASTTDTSCPTGASVNTLSTTSDYIKNTGLTSTVHYKLSFWYKGDATITVTGGTQQNIVLQANKKNGWNYTERTITDTNTVTISMTGSGTVSVDEVRLYPVSAQMSTYTYYNDGKLQSATDANNVTTYYEYDGFDRLKAIRNDAGSLLSSYEYHYKQQQ